MTLWPGCVYGDAILRSFERGGGEKVASGDGTSVGCREACLAMNHPPFMKGGKPSVDFDRPIAALGA